MVRLQRASERVPLLREIGGIGRVACPVVGGDPVGDLLDPVGVVPEMWVVARLLVEQVGNREHLPARTGVGRQELLAPIVVAGAIQDDVVSGREGTRIGRAALVLVRVRARVGDDTRHRYMRAAQLGGDAAPEVLARDYLKRRARTGARGLRAAGGQHIAQEGGYE